MGVLSKLRGRRRLGHSRYYELFIAPLSRRERFIYGGLITAILLAIIIPRVSADVSNIGTLMYVPSRQCVTDTSGWSHPELAIGLPNVGSEASPDQLTPENSAANFDVAGQLICNQFTNTTDVRRASALDISMALSPSLGTESIGDTTPQANSQPTEPTRVDKRAEPIPPNRFSDQNKSDLDDLVRLSVSKDNGKTWQVLHVFGPELLNSTAVHQAVFLPDEYNANLNNLAVMVEYLVGGNNDKHLLIDSINVSYEVGRKQQLELRTIRPERAGELSVLSNTDGAQFGLRSKPAGSGFVQGVTKVITQTVRSASQPEPAISVQANAINSTTQAVTPINTKLSWKSYDIDNNANWDVKVDLPRSASPGRYTLNMEVTSDNGAVQVLTQDFLWGVLAMNFDSSIYKSGQSVSIMMAVLNDHGYSVCDAIVDLDISLNGKLITHQSTSDQSITVSKTCDQYLASLPPDYMSHFVPQAPGTYSVKLTAQTNNGSYEIVDHFKVDDNPNIVITRQASTRIYPVFASSMIITINSPTSTQASIQEVLPSSFTIRKISFAMSPNKIEQNGDEQTLTWNVNLTANQPTTLGYVYDAPDVSPEFYLIGPMSVNDDSNTQLAAESRAWQLAGDAIGDIAVYREATGGETITTTLANQTWDTTTTQGGAFSINIGRDTVTLSDAGHYFLTYNIALDGSTGRSETNALVNLGGSSLAYGRGSCYIRRTNAVNECWLSSSAIINASASDSLIIQAQRTDSGSGTVTRRANESGVSLVKLDDSWDYLRLQESGGGQTFNSTTFSSVTWDTNDEVDAGSFTHSTSANSDQITLGGAGNYLVSVNMMFRNSGTSRRNNEMRLSLNGTEIPGTRTTAYLRGTNSTQDESAHYVGVISASANDILRIEGACEGDTCGGVTNVGGQTAVTIVKLPGTTQALRIHEAGGGQAVDGTNAPVLFDSNDEIDSDYSHDTATNSSRVNINTADNYLFLGSFYNNRAGTSSTGRQQPHWEWQLNGSTVMQRGSFARYNRGSASGGTYAAGNSGAVLLNGLSLGDYVELINTDESSTTDATSTFIANRYAMQAINITSLFISDPFTDQAHFRWRDDSTALNTSGGWLATEDNNGIGNLAKGSSLRLRIETANVGTTVEAAARQYELQFADKTTQSCSTASGWTGVANSSTDAIDMFDTTFYTNGANVTPGLLANSESYSFTTGRAQDNGFDTTASIGPLASGGYTELEYAVSVSNNAVTGHSYCLRLYDQQNATVLDSYSVFPELTVDSTAISFPSTLGEAGRVAVPADGGWATVNFAGTYTTPVVVGVSNTHNSQNALVFEARNVTSTSAQIRLCETEGATANGCDTHASETAGYLVIDKAVADVTSGIEAGNFTTSGEDDTTNVTTVFGTAFSVKPSVFANVNTVNDSKVPTEVIINSVTANNFNSGLCQSLVGSQDNCDSTHTTETIGWVAVDPTNMPFDEQAQIDQINIDSDNGTWTSVVFSPNFVATPVLLAASQTDTGGQDPEIDNARLVTTTGADVRFCEMDTLDNCDTHSADDYTWLAIENTQLQDIVNLDQDTYRFYDNVDAVQPTTPKASENSAITGVSTNDVLRIRMAVQAGSESLGATKSDFKLQYGVRTTTCSAISTWSDVGAAGSALAWRGYDNSTPTNGANVSASLLNGGANNLESYVESNNSPSNPNAIGDGQRGEWDWVVQNYSATNGTDYCFRMTTASSKPINYSQYPQLATFGTNTSPNNPASLVQKKTDATVLGIGDWTDETSVVFSGSASDTNSTDSLELCVEIKPIGTGFNGSNTACGPPVSYTGTAVSASVTIGGLTNTTEYHWQARVRDGGGLYSSWVSYGGNAESARDVGVDTVAPAGTVYDGSNAGVDVDFNNGSLSSLSANWNITDGSSGIGQFEYSIGTSAGATDIKSWTNVALATSITDSSLSLNTSQPYFFNIRATDNAGNQSTVSSDGQFVSPTLSFGTAPPIVTFANLNAGNSYTDTKSTTLTTSTNAYNGYTIRAYAENLLTSSGSDTIPVFDGGTYAAPDEWLGGDIGYGYTSSDTTIQGVNIFGGSPCLGGGNPPCYAPFSLLTPGDIVADHTALISGSPVVNESFIVTHRVTVDVAQPAGTYSTQIIYSISARY